MARPAARPVPARTDPAKTDPDPGTGTGTGPGTGPRPRPVIVDLNADLGEGDGPEPTASDLGVISSVTSVSIACGFHAGSPALMHRTAQACLGAGVVIGAHPSYRDRDGFGRRALDVPPEVLRDELLEQCAELDARVVDVGGRVAYVKPHGALYHRMAGDPAVAAMVAEVVAARPSPVLVAPPGSRVVDLARKAGVTVVGEAFPERGYRADGSLAPRDRPGAVVVDPADAAARAVAFALRGGVRTLDGTWVDVPARTLCIHGDAVGADRRARAVRAALAGVGVTVAPFCEPSDAASNGP